MQRDLSPDGAVQRVALKTLNEEEAVGDDCEVYTVWVDASGAAGCR